MDNFCKICGAELLDGVCPNCSQEQDEPKPEEVAPETTDEVTEAPLGELTEAESEQEDSPQTETQQEPEPEADESAAQEFEQAPSVQTVEEAPAPYADEVRPSKFYYAFKQVGNVIRHFFSKHTVDAITDQYHEILPIWVILMPVCAVISALSMALSFDGTHGLSIGAGSLFSGMSLSSLEVFLISFAMSLAVEFIYSIAVMIFFRSFKIKAKFKAAANLTMSAYIAVTVMNLFNIITIGTFNSESTTLSGFGMIAFILLLYLGIIKVLKDKKPFWSFFLTMTCASLAALIAALVVTCPIIVMRGLEQLASTNITIN